MTTMQIVFDGATYTVFDPDSTSTATRGLTLAEAADRLLTSDGYTYEIRPDHRDGGGFTLWASMSSQNAPGPEAMTDAAFDAMLAEIAASEEEG